MIESTSTIYIVIVFFLICILIGYFASRKEDSEGFLIANRTVGSFQAVMSLCADFVGAMTLLVYTAFVFTFGISAMWMFVGYLIGFIVFSFFAVHIKNYSEGKNFYTINDYFKHRFGKKVALFVASAIFIWYFGSLSAQFIGGGKVLTELTGIDYKISAVIMYVVILTYLLMGGLKVSLKTDAFQFLVLGIILVIMTFTIKTGLQIPISHFDPFNAGATNIVAFLLLGIFTPFASQDYWQRVLAMKNTTVVKKSFIISGFLVFFIALFLTYIGLVAKTKFSNIDADIAVLYSFI